MPFIAESEPGLVMTRLLITVAALLIASLPAMGLAQEVASTSLQGQMRGNISPAGPTGTLPQGPFSRSDRGAPWPLYDRRKTARIYAGIGYERSRLNVSFPLAQPDFDGASHFLSMELTMKQGSYLVGIVDLELEPVASLSFFGRLAANNPDSAQMLMEFTGAVGRTTGPGSAANAVSPWNWGADPYQWWMAEGGLALGVEGPCALVLGFRNEHLDFTLKKPVGGTSITAVRILQQPDATGQIIADAFTTIYLPYIGIGGKTDYGGEVRYRWRLIGSLFAWTDLKMPVTINATSATAQEITTARYDLATNRCQFVECDFDCSVGLTNSLSSVFWASAGFFRALGKGEITSSVAASTLFNVQPGEYVSEESSVTRNFCAVGLSLELGF